MVDELEFLEGGNYLSLSTLKKSGESVQTPVWFGMAGGAYYIFSAADAGKKKGGGGKRGGMKIST